MEAIMNVIYVVVMILSALYPPAAAAQVDLVGRYVEWDNVRYDEDGTLTFWNDGEVVWTGGTWQHTTWHEWLGCEEYTETVVASCTMDPDHTMDQEIEYRRLAILWGELDADVLTVELVEGGHMIATTTDGLMMHLDLGW